MKFQIKEQGARSEEAGIHTAAKATEKIAPQASRVFECAVRLRRLLPLILFAGI
jgi:hypothetical protein